MLNCCRCQESKAESEFSPNPRRSRGYAYFCKSCGAATKRKRYWTNPEAGRSKDRTYRQANAQRHRDSVNAHRQRNKAKVAARRKELRERDLAAYNRKSRVYALSRPHKRREYEQRRRETDLNWSILSRLRNRLRGAVYHRGVKKCARTVELLGCSIDAFKKHIESLFKPGMSWENRHLWHIDHDKPCARFDFRDPAQQRACFHFSNLQPLWYWENQAKRDRVLEAA